MLDRHERDQLREIERRITATDPELAALLRSHRRLGWAGARLRQRVMVALVLLAVALLVLGPPSSALVVGAVAVIWMWLTRFRMSHQP